MKPKHRIRIVIRNIGLELPGAAEGVLTIDFGTETSFKAALKKLEDAFAEKDLKQSSVILENDRGEMLGFNPNHYSYHTVPVEDFGEWCPVGCVWALPGKNMKRRRST